MVMSLTRQRLVRGLGATLVGALMVFGSLAPAGAADPPDNGCDSGVGGITIFFRDVGQKSSGSYVGSRSSGPCVLIMNLSARRYSSGTGEIMWDRAPGAVGYEIFRNGESLGIHDVLSWYMTDLEPGSDYEFRIDAFDQDGNFMRYTASVTLEAWQAWSDCSISSYC